MPTPNPYFLYPFGGQGDDTAIPNTGGSTGNMSYQYGFTPNYEANLLTDPSAIPVPRQQMNQLFFDITTALQIIQTQGLPTYVPVGSGGAANYPLGAMVRYLNKNYISMVPTNTSVPAANNDWLQLGTYITTNIAAAATVSLPTSGVAVAIGAISLPPGLWRIDGNVNVGFSAVSPTAVSMSAWTSITGDPEPDHSFLGYGTPITAASDTTGCITPTVQLSLTAPASVSLYAIAFFIGGTANAFGNISATLLNYPY